MFKLNTPILLRLLMLLAAATPARWASAQQGTWASGITEPINDVLLSAPLAGIVGQRFYKEGDFVKQGATLIELDKKLEELEVDRRKLVLDQRKTDLDSTKSLFEKKAISVSREEMDKRIAEFNIANVEHDLAKEQLKKRQIVAPFDGSITDLYLEVGEACQAQQAVLRMVDTRRCYLVCNVEAKVGYALKAGQDARLEVEAGAASVPVQGKITFVSPVVDPASGLLKVRVLFENPEGKIRPGVAGKMFIQEG